jgi:hypothetical protein
MDPNEGLLTRQHLKVKDQGLTLGKILATAANLLTLGAFAGYRIGFQENEAGFAVGTPLKVLGELYYNPKEGTWRVVAEQIIGQKQFGAVKRACLGDLIGYTFLVGLGITVALYCFAGSIAEAQKIYRSWKAKRRNTGPRPWTKIVPPPDVEIRDELTCYLCLKCERAVRTMFYHACGHLVGCSDCFTLNGPPCPICQKPGALRKILQIF